MVDGAAMSGSTPAGQGAPPLVHGLSAFAGDYDVILCDIWGVIHNGVAAFPAACAALEKARAGGARVVLVSNAPRPNPYVSIILDGLGAPRSAYDAIVTSGDVTRMLMSQHSGSRMFHLGPERDLPLFEGVDVTLVPLEEAQGVVCTGLFDDTVETPDDYAEMLARMGEQELPFICANPDLVVERGPRLIYCAGAIAVAYEAIGGEVAYCGKPHQPIYDLALQTATDLCGRQIDHSRVLAIGDALRTDILGASRMGLDSLFIAAGIHAQDLRADDETAPDEGALAALFEGQPRPRGVMSRLSW